MIYLIYKILYDKQGGIDGIELVEADVNETSVASFNKLLNLQRAHDLRNRIEYNYFPVRILG